MQLHHFLDIKLSRRTRLEYKEYHARYLRSRCELLCYMLTMAYVWSWCFVSESWGCGLFWRVVVGILIAVVTRAIVHEEAFYPSER